MIPVDYAFITIHIMPCVVDKFEGELLVPAYVEFLVDQDPQSYTWLEYT